MSEQSTALEQPVKRRRGRPRKEEVLTRERPEKRTPMSETRDVLTVEGKDPNFEYYWFRDEDESGQRIWNAINAGYSFVTRDSDRVNLPDYNVFSSNKYGNIYRKSAGMGKWLYLMKKPKEWWDEDQAVKQKKVDEMESAMVHREKTEEGRYGDLKIGHNIL